MNKRALFPAAVALLSLVSCGGHSRTEDLAELRSLQNRLVDAFRARDVDRIMSCYIADESLLVFDVVTPRQYKGAKAYRKDWADLLAAFPGKPEAELIDPYVDVDRDMGYGHMIVHYVMKDKDGKPLDLTARLTDAYRRVDGKWLVVHEHVSWPVELPSGKADLQSKP